MARFGAIAGFHRLVEGEDSAAFGFSAAGSAYVARVNRSAAGFEKDRLAFERFNAPALPVPEIVAIAPLGELFLCISRRLPGETLQALPAGGAKRYGAAVGALLDALANQDMGAFPGFGIFDAHGRAPHRHWRDVIAATAALPWRDLASPEEMALVAPLLDRLLGASAGLEDVAGLVHGDFGSNNVLVEAGRITGLIDWSEAMIGDPLYDVANILFWRPWLDSVEQQGRHFETVEPFRLRDAERLACYQLRIGLETLAEARRAGDRRTGDWALSRCLAVAGSIRPG